MKKEREVDDMSMKEKLLKLWRDALLIVLMEVRSYCLIHKCFLN
jgi:hypothetical protein